MTARVRKRGTIVRDRQGVGSIERGFDSMGSINREDLTARFDSKSSIVSESSKARFDSEWVRQRVDSTTTRSRSDSKDTTARIRQR